MRSVRISANDVAEQVLATEDAWLQAIASNDRKALEALAADEFTLVLASGVVLHRDVAMTGHGLCNDGDGALTNDALDVRLYGKTAVVLGRRSAQKSRRAVRFMDVFVLRDQRWQLVAEEITPIQD
jgi:hypothetical protein